MTTGQMKCLLVTRDEDKNVSRTVTEVSRDDLPAGDVVIRVVYSSLNYKDALAATGHPGVARKFPHVPGIDAAGYVVESSAAELSEGDAVLVTGFDLGAGQWGGFAQYVRVPAGWVVPLPAGLSLREAMIYGTAGFTAALGVEALVACPTVAEGDEIVVTGASGGVGCVAVALLAKAGFRPVASTGKAAAGDFLSGLGAVEIVDRQSVHDDSGKPMLRERWAGAVDTVGGLTLSTVIRSTRPFGCVTACGLVGGTDLPLSVYPFILRGVQLVGLDSAHYAIHRRGGLWRHLAEDWRPDDLEALVARTVSLDDIQQPIDEILAGRVQGRIVVVVSDE